MINGHELRPGNWVQGQPLSIPKWGWWSNGQVRVTSYGVHMICVDGSKYSGIPLTPDILIKCGFEKRTDHSGPLDSIDYYEKNWGDLEFPRGNHLPRGRFSCCLDIGGGLHLNGYAHNIPKSGNKCLHNLQNLYFCITGEELIYNP